VSEWRHQNSLSGRKTYKVEFVKKAFHNDFSYFPLALGASTDSSKAFKKTFRVFKSKHTNTITARNYLLQLYNEVSEPIIRALRITDYL